MRHVSPPPLAELTARAQTLTSVGDLVGARRVLATALDPADAADPRHADADLALAAALHARVLVALGDAHDARLWAGFAHAAEERLHGPRDERTVAAAATHAAVLQRAGHHDPAAQVYLQLVRDLAAVDGPDSPRVLAAEADLATAEHGAGHCTSGRDRLTDAWIRHRHRHGDAVPAGIKMLARLGAMERECGLDAQAREHLALAQELCARHLPVDHPLVRQVAALALAPAAGRHRCGRMGQQDGPRAAPLPRQPTVPAPEPSALPPEHPVLPTPDNRPTDPTGTAYPQPLHPSDALQAPGDPAGWPRPVGTVPASTRATPPNSERLLPVRTGHPAPPPRNRQPFLLVTVLIAGIAVAISVVALTLPDTNGAVGARTPPIASVAPPAATAPGPAAASTRASTTPSGTPAAGAPERVRLRDNRDSVALTWAYPKDAEGPLLISGGRLGQQLRMFQQLPAGTGDYLVYGLNPQQDYCFTVAVAYSTDRIAASAPICTRR